MFKKAAALVTITVLSVLMIPTTVFANSNSVSFSVTLRIPPRPVEQRFEEIKGEKIVRNGEIVLVKTIIDE